MTPPPKLQSQTLKPKLSEQQIKLLQANKLRAEQILLNIKRSLPPQVSHYVIVKKEYQDE